MIPEALAAPRLSLGFVESVSVPFCWLLFVFGPNLRSCSYYQPNGESACLSCSYLGRRTLGQSSDSRSFAPLMQCSAYSRFNRACVHCSLLAYGRLPGHGVLVDSGVTIGAATTMSFRHRRLSIVIVASMQCMFTMLSTLHFSGFDLMSHYGTQPYVT